MRCPSKCIRDITGHGKGLNLNANTQRLGNRPQHIRPDPLRHSLFVQTTGQQLVAHIHRRAQHRRVSKLGKSIRIHLHIRSACQFSDNPHQRPVNIFRFHARTIESKGLFTPVAEKSPGTAKTVIRIRQYLFVTLRNAMLPLPTGIQVIIRCIFS